MTVFKKFLCIFPLCIILGCSDATPVTGTIKWADGNPFTEGIITFENEKTNVVGTLDAQGHFSLFQMKPGDRVPPGSYRGAITPEMYVQIPSKFTSVTTSGLAITVESGQPVHLDIVLE